MDEFQTPELGDLFVDADGVIYEFRYDIDTNSFGWFETCFDCVARNGHQPNTKEG